MNNINGFAPKFRFDNNLGAKIVTINVKFMWIGEIDIKNERFQAKVIIESIWDLDKTIEKYDPKIHQNPKIVIENAMTDVKEEIEYELVQTSSANTVVEKRLAKGNA